jgi:hypothetical protein
MEFIVGKVELARYEKYHVCNPSILSQRAFDGAHESQGVPHEIYR